MLSALLLIAVQPQEKHQRDQLLTDEHLLRTISGEVGGTGIFNDNVKKRAKKP